MNILIYYTPNSFTVGGISVGKKLQEKGHKVFFLTQQKEGQLHESLRKYGIEALAVPEFSGSKFSRFYREVSFVRKFIKDNSVGIVFSHLGANLISVAAAYFSKASFFLFRHHTDEIKKYGNRNGRLGDWFITRFGKMIVSPCSNVTNHLLAEGCNPRKIVEISYGYDFNLYPKPNVAEIAEVRNKYPAKLLLTIVSRHIPAKRHLLLFEVLSQLINKEQYDIQCLVLDRGPLTEQLKEFVIKHKLENRIHFIGFTNSVMSYIAAADMVPHLSDSEASNSVIKEAGISRKIVAVCKGVGDFDDYIIAGQNGFLMDKESPSADLEKAIREVYENKEKYTEFGDRLCEMVHDKFDMDKVYPQYEKLIRDVENKKSHASQDQ